jgi:hypothetical protein
VESVLTTPPRVRVQAPAPWSSQQAPPAGRAAQVPWAVLTAALLVGVWWIMAPRTPDLAGQVYRARLFEQAGFVLWNNGWYAGHQIPGYSLTWPWLGSWLGVRASGVVAVLASAYLFERLARRLYGPHTAAAATWFAVAAAGDAWIGRLTFALGVTFALAAALCAVRAVSEDGRASLARDQLAGLLGGICAATSPVAGLLLVLAYVSWAIGAAVSEGPPRSGRSIGRLVRAVATRVRPLRAAVLAPLVVVIALHVLFPEGGFEPYAASSIAAALAVTLAFVLALPREDRLLRVAAVVYAFANLLALAPTPMGSNIQRYGVLLAGPLLLCALGARGGLRSSRLPRWALLTALAGMGLWVVWGPIVQTLGTSDDPSTRASYYVPLERFLREHTAGPLRIEVPFTRSHWEAAFLPPRFPLARGWERQLDKRYDLELESHTLSARAYREWLGRLGVSYVALPDVPFDQSSDGEVRLIRQGVPYLREVFRSAHWRVFRVLDASPLVVPVERVGAGGAFAAGGGAVLTSLGEQSFALTVSSPGHYLVKVRYSPYWTVNSGVASVREGHGGFTEVLVRRAGVVAVGAQFSPAGAWRALGVALEGA